MKVCKFYLFLYLPFVILFRALSITIAPLINKIFCILKLFFIFTYETTRTMTLIKNNRPTESELEILQILWQKKSATVRDVHEVILKTKDAGYTTTLKLMQIMFEKGLVNRDSSNKTHIYQPVLSKEKTQNLFLNKMIDTLFAGSPAMLVMQALGNHKATKDELEEISKFLNSIK